MSYTPSSEPDTSSLPASQGIRAWFGSTAIFAGIMACVLGTAVMVSAVGGLAAGQRDLNFRATQTTAAELDGQYQLGLNDLAAGRNDLAAQRFQWVLERSPDYPGALEALAQANTENPVGTTVPTIPPSSADSIEELYAEAETFYDEGQWESTLARLDELIVLDPTYRQTDVKDMQFTAYQELGLSYVRGDRIEEGLYLLGQAALIHPLDDRAAGERNLANLYLTGLTYWGLNWPVVIQNLRVIYDAAPNYRDVDDRMREAYVRFGDELSVNGDACGAETQYEEALLLQADEAVDEKYQQARHDCANPTAAPTPTFPTLSGLTETPSVSATSPLTGPGVTTTPDGGIP